MPDPSLRLVPHPLPVRLHVRGNPLRPVPCRESGVDIGVNRRPPGEAGRYLDHRLVDQHCHRVQVPCHCPEPQPLRLQWDRPTPGERVQDRRRPVREAPVDLRPSRAQHVRIVGVLPLHEPFEDPKQPLPLDILLLGRQRLVPRRIVHQRCPDHRPSRRQRPPRPPEVQRRRMTMPYRLLPSRLLVDRRQRQRHLNQLRLVPHHGRSPYQPAPHRWPASTHQTSNIFHIFQYLCLNIHVLRPAYVSLSQWHRKLEPWLTAAPSSGLMRPGTRSRVALRHHRVATTATRSHWLHV